MIGSTRTDKMPSIARMRSSVASVGSVSRSTSVYESSSREWLSMSAMLMFCAAFLHRPRAVVVDEPMVGLDPRGARLIKSVFRTMSARGVAILMSTHTLEVAEEMCDRISIILKGRIIARGSVAEVRAMGDSHDDQLTSVFLKLTGGSGLQEIDEIV